MQMVRQLEPLQVRPTGVHSQWVNGSEFGQRALQEMSRPAVSAKCRQIHKYAHRHTHKQYSMHPSLAPTLVHTMSFPYLPYLPTYLHSNASNSLAMGHLVPSTVKR